jgi:glycosyltransferase involved in cell wall biosynthesis
VKVLHLLIRMPGSGTERQLAGTLRAAHGEAWNATLCVLHAGYPLAAELSASIPVVEFDVRSDHERLRTLRRLVRLGNFDVVHSSLWGGNVAGRLAAARVERPAVVVSERRVEDFRSGPARAVDRVLRPLADHFIANSEDVAAFVRRAHGVGADRVSVIRNGVDTTVFRPRAARRRAPGAPARIGGLGRLVPQKCFDMAIAALDAVLARRPAELVIAGEGPERARLEELARGLPVTFGGYLGSPAEVAAFLSGLDVLVLPSRYEGLPNAVLEARACGIPVVATDVPGVAEAADAGVTLVPADDPPALARALLAVLDRPVGASLEVRSFAQVADGHLDAFERALARRGRNRVITVPELTQGAR